MDGCPYSCSVIPLTTNVSDFASRLPRVTAALISLIILWPCHSVMFRKPAKLLIQSLSTFWIRAGICATRPIRCPSLNTLSLRSAQGRGLALEAVTAGHKWFEEQRGPTRTVCLIKAQNEGSLRLGSKVGIARLAAAFTSTIAI